VPRLSPLPFLLCVLAGCRRDASDPTPLSAPPTHLLAGTEYPELVAYEPDGRRIAVTEKAGVFVYDIATGREAMRFRVPSWAHGMAFLPAGRGVLVADRDGWLSLFTDSDADPAWRIGVAHTLDDVKVLVVSTDGARALTAAADSTVRAVDLTEKRELHRLSDQAAEISCATFLGSSHRALTVEPLRFRIWDVDTGVELASLEAPDEPVRSIASSGDGRRVALVSEHHPLRVLEVDSMREIRSFDLTVLDGAKRVAMARDGRRVLTASDHVACLWDVDRGQRVDCDFGFDHGEAIAFSPDERYAAYAAQGGIHLWRLPAAASAPNASAWPSAPPPTPPPPAPALAGANATERERAVLGLMAGVRPASNLPVESGSVRLPAGGPSRGDVVLGEVATSHSVPNLDPTIAQLRKKYRQCFLGGLANNPLAAGTLTLTVHVGSSGEVAAAEAKNSGVPAPILTCLLQVTQTARFDAPGADTTLTIPLKLTRPSKN
jgi:hypothetical protein